MKSILANRALFAILVAVAAAVALWACAPGDSSEAASADPGHDGPGDIAVLPTGKAVDLQSQAVPGKVTIYDFHADWCAPCRILTPRLEELAHEHPEKVALRKVDVVSWESEAAVSQGIEYLPYLAIVDASGAIAAEGDPSFDYVKELFGVDLMATLLIL